METTQNRFKSPVFWSGVVAQIVSILLFSGIIDVTQSEIVNGIVAAACQIWVLVSQANNPSSTEW